MNKKLLIPLILFAVISIGSIFMLSGNKNIKSLATENDQMTNQLILFYGDGCPHCKIVEEYLDSNNVSEKVSYVMKEVYYNKQNANELVEKARICGMPTDSIGVPFFWDGTKCFVGDQDIIEFFKQKINLQ